MGKCVGERASFVLGQTKQELEVKEIRWPEPE